MARRIFQNGWLPKKALPLVLSAFHSRFLFRLYIYLFKRTCFRANKNFMTSPAFCTFHLLITNREIFYIKTWHSDKKKKKNESTTKKTTNLNWMPLIFLVAKYNSAKISEQTVLHIDIPDSYVGDKRLFEIKKFATLITAWICLQCAVKLKAWYRDFSRQLEISLSLGVIIKKGMYSLSLFHSAF